MIRSTTIFLTRMSVVAVFTCTLTACHVPVKKPPDIQLRTNAPLAGIPEEIAGWPDQQWWKSFGDAQLDTLIDLAQKQSPALDVLDARLQIARAQVDAARANAGPDVNGLAAVSRSRFSVTPKPSSGSSSSGNSSGGDSGSAPSSSGGSQGFTLPTWTTSAIVGADFRYEFDWWGKNRAAIEAAMDSAHAAEVERSAALWLIQYGVATVYFDWLTLQHRLADADEAVRIAETQLEIARQRTTHGVDPPQTFEQQRENLASAKQQREAMRGGSNADQAEIAALLGVSANEVPALTAKPLPHADTKVPDDVRVALLGRRPDIVASRWMIESAARNVDEARAEFFPDISINALAAFLRSFPTPGSPMSIKAGSVGLSAYLPIFDSGRLQAHYDITRAQWDSAVAQYNAAVVAAAEDVVRQKVMLESLHDQRAQQLDQLDAADNAYKQSVQRVKTGVDDPRVALGAQAQLVQQRDAAVQMDSRVLAANLSLIRALGGGYRTDANVSAAAGDMHNDSGKTP
jgi:NodT family efflux transporter outer membrane factor (OMF) lipoprotein